MKTYQYLADQLAACNASISFHQSRILEIARYDDATRFSAEYRNHTQCLRDAEAEARSYMRQINKHYRRQHEQAMMMRNRMAAGAA